MLIPIKIYKAETVISVDMDKLPDPAFVYLVKLGLTQKLNGPGRPKGMTKSEAHADALERLRRLEAMCGPVL